MIFHYINGNYISPSIFGKLKRLFEPYIILKKTDAKDEKVVEVRTFTVPVRTC
jgi:hypothetical protein